MLPINTYSSHLIKQKSRICVPKIRSDHAAAYPSDGHNSCFEIEDSSFWFKHRNNCIIETVKNHPPNGPIFDIGGGNGYVTHALYKNGFEAILVEPNKIGVQNALKRGISLAIEATLEEAKFNRNTIPAIGLFDVLEHIQDDKKFLRKIYNILKPNGKIYITVPAFRLLWSAQDIYAQHFRRYILRDISQLLNSLKFKIDYSTYFFTFLPLPIFIFRTLPMRLKLLKVYTTRQFQSEMISSAGPANPIIDSLLNVELNKVKKKKYLPFGSSILIAAHKIE